MLCKCVRPCAQTLLHDPLNLTLTLTTTCLLLALLTVDPLCILRGLEPSKELATSELLLLLLLLLLLMTTMMTMMIMSGIHDLAPGDLLHKKLEDYFAAGAGAGAAVVSR